MIFGKSGKLPYPLDVTCNQGKLNDFIQACNFIVILNEYTFGFSEVSGLDKDLSSDDIREGGNVYPVFTRKYEYNFEQITLTKGLLIRQGDYASDTIRTLLSQAAMLNNSTARKAAVIAAVASDPVATLEQGPAYGFIQVFDRQYKTPLASFSFFSYGASRWDVTNLSAQSCEILYENITLVCSDLRRLSNSFIASSALNKKFSDNQKYNYYELTDEQKKEHKKTYTRNNEDQSAEENKIDSLINAAKQNDENIKEDQKTRIEAFKQWQDSVKEKRKKEIEEKQEREQKNESSKVDINKWQEDTKSKREEESKELQEKEQKVESSKVDMNKWKEDTKSKNEDKNKELQEKEQNDNKNSDNDTENQ